MHNRRPIILPAGQRTADRDALALILAQIVRAVIERRQQKG